MSIVSNISDGATGRVFIAPNKIQPEGQSEVWLNLGPFMKSSPLQAMNAPKYPAFLQSAGVSQAQFESLLADIQAAIDARMLPYWYAGCSGCTMCCGIGLLGCLHIKMVMLSIVAAVKKVVENNGAFELVYVDQVPFPMYGPYNPDSIAFDLDGACFQQQMQRKRMVQWAASWPPTRASKNPSQL